jgi:DNA-binding MarR family transcriptional regulator
MVWACIASGQEAGPPVSPPTTEPVAAAAVPAGGAVSQPTTTQAAGGEEAVKATAEKRTADVLKALALADAAAEAKVRDVLTAFFVKRITWGPNDDKIKDLEAQLAKLKKDGDEAKVKQLTAQIAALRAELVAMHDALVADLAKVLRPEQIDTVKEVLTYGRGKIVYNKIVTDHVLTDLQKAAVAKLLNDARDKAWMEGSSSDKHKVFDKAVGRVNNYLDALKKVQAAGEAIQAGKLKEAQEIIAKLEQRDWLKELLGQELVDLRTSLEAARSGRPATSAPATTRPAGD